MKAKVLLVMVACLLATVLGADASSSFDYTSAWKEIWKLQEKRLPESMTAKVDSLYDAAVAEDKFDQQIKALIIQLYIIQNKQEFSQLKSITRMRQALLTAKEPATSIMHSMLAEIYWGYYQQNRNKFAQRTQTDNFDPQDIATWDLKTLTLETLLEFNLSLANAGMLQQMKISEYWTFIEHGGANERLLRPTLYDFLARRALDFYKFEESALTLPLDEFKLDDANLFGSTTSFLNLTFSTADTLSLKYKAIVLFQDLVCFHSNDEDPAALVELETERLAYVFRKTTHANAAKLYEESLKSLSKKYEKYPDYALIQYYLATLYRNLGDKYDSSVSEDYRWHYRDAVDICNDAIEKYPQSSGADFCRALAGEIKLPFLNLTAESDVLPNTRFNVCLDSRNISGVRIRIFKIPYFDNANKVLYNRMRNWREDNQYKALVKLDVIWEKNFTITNEGDFRDRTYELPINSLPKGSYAIIAEDIKTEGAPEIVGVTYFSCNEISYNKHVFDDSKMILLNRKTGFPISDALVEIYRITDHSTHRDTLVIAWSGKSDEEGLVDVVYKPKWSNRYIACVSTEADTLIIPNYDGSLGWAQSRQDSVTLLFTDRSIYRPGQTVFFKGVKFLTDHEKKYDLDKSGGKVDIFLLDANHKEIERKKTIISEFGTFDASFSIPQNVMPGQWMLQTQVGSVTFNVEEYKRPRFEVSINKPTATYKLNQIASLKGKALTYSGFPVDNSQVSYRITRQTVYPRWRWWWGTQPDSQEKEIASGTATTDELGEFTLSFLAAGDVTALRKYNPYFSFKISVDVTDISGETRSGSMALSIGEKELLLDMEVAEEIDLASGKLIIPIKTTNLGGEAIPAKGQVTISSLQAPDRVLRERIWSAPDRNYLSPELFKRLFPHEAFMDEDKMYNWKVAERMYKGTFNTQDAVTLNIQDFKSWSPGVYLLEALSMYNGEEVKETRYFTVYDSRSTQLPYPKVDWYVPVKVVCEPGEQAQILIGSGYTNVSVLFEIERDHKITSQERIYLSNSQRLLSIPVNVADRGGFFVYLTFVRNGRLYAHAQEITVPWTNKQISFEYSTFRDKLLPGQDEEWRIKLRDHTGGKITAEVLASMYDASLDAFLPSKWTTNIFGKVVRHQGWANIAVSGINTLSFLKTPNVYHRFPQRMFSAIRWYPYYTYVSWGNRTGSEETETAYFAALSQFGSLQKTSATYDRVESDRAYNFEPVISEDLVANSDRSGIVALKAGVTMIGEPSNQSQLSSIAPRTNFAETAFFYPKLLTDENGEVSFAFKVPESLTKWKFRAMALTKELQIGTTENSAVTQKPLMVMPNAPRFFREGDKITLSAKVSSLDEAEHLGQCRLYLFDAISMTPIDSLFQVTNPQQGFRASKGESAALNWELDIPLGISAVTYRVVASSGSFSDGEENTIPILSNRMLVTESLPLPVRGYSTKSFVFDKLRSSGGSSTLRSHKLTLEYTSNPAWYAVQALPYMMEYPYECNEQIFTRLYANALATHIANSNPRIKRVFDSWKNTPGSQALLSNLEKNQELKSVLLQETPWIWDGLNESQSKQRIGFLLDLNHMANEYASTVTRLQKNQNADGGWSWFPGGQTSWWITQYIVEGFGHLAHLGVTSVRKDAAVWGMVKSAIRYIDNELLQDYKRIMESEHPEYDHLGYMQMHYLYARSFFKDIAIPTETLVAVEYFRNQADEYCLNEDVYGQGLIALARHRDGNKTTPGLILASLKERALHDEEMGMWWRGNETGWFWYQAPIETQALLIEVFTEVINDTASVDEMRTWLLKRKQTTNWKTTKATAQACYAMLLTGTEWLDTDKLATITLGERTIDPMQMDSEAPEAGTGYFKTSWSGNEIKPVMAEITVTNPNPVSSWGAVYWQYFEDMDKITPAETPLKLQKQLFVERITDTGKILDPIIDGTQLKLGDKVIVRIELRSDRDMEYVHMKDMRSAGFEPINVLSRYKWQDGLCYYEATGDAATNFFFDYLRKGTYVFEYPLRVFNKGDFSNGITTIQCMYAPEYTSHSEGIRVQVR